MRYKKLVQTKLELISNKIIKVDSLLSSNQPLGEVRRAVEEVRELIQETQVLVEKENQQ